ncbi:hypothetical protein RJ639_001123 [Escallonia herrerae]|uniref:Uncharacterized protein n=1 Tax=Escallonia herrerae TaxID=1293975 RepID=A0AA88XI74_9ASTE|nr:hypothetical protein RJ639_001123 [Escallonia herrerae]
MKLSEYTNMSSAWTNMSFGIIRRDVDGEWEKSGWSCGYFYLWSILEHMSNGACGASLTSRIALLVCFMHCSETCSLSAFYRF